MHTKGTSFLAIFSQLQRIVDTTRILHKHTLLCNDIPVPISRALLSIQILIPSNKYQGSQQVCHHNDALRNVQYKKSVVDNVTGCHAPGSRPASIVEVICSWIGSAADIATERKSFPGRTVMYVEMENMQLEWTVGNVVAGVSILSNVATVTMASTR